MKLKKYNTFPIGLVRNCLPLLLILSAFQIQSHIFRKQKSVTVDETCHLVCGINTIAQHRLDPAMTEFGQAPLPVIVQLLPVLANVEVHLRPLYWVGMPTDPALISHARLWTSLSIGSALIAAAYVWLFRRRGIWAAIFGAGLLALSPSLVSHCNLATTDAITALMWLISVVVFAQYANHPTLKWCVAAAICCGLALAAKYSSLLLIFLFLILNTIVFFGGVNQIIAKKTIGWRASQWLLINIVFFYISSTCLWGIHGFEVAIFHERGAHHEKNLGWTSVLSGVELPTPFVGVLNQRQHNQDGQTAMLLGKVRMKGWWYYFPLAALIKSTPTELAVVCWGATLAIVSTFRTRKCRSRILIDFSRFTFWFALALSALFFSQVRVQIGFRYLLPMFVIAMLLSVDYIFSAYEKVRPTVLKVVPILILLLGQVLTSIVSAPHYLSYTSPLFGSPKNSYRLLADSNVDWGQDLPALRDELKRLPKGEVALCYCIASIETGVLI